MSAMDAEPWFRAVPVASDLRADLATAWAVRTSDDHDLVPDACVDIMWLSDGDVVVCGPETRGWTFEPPSGAQAVGVRLRPGHAGRVLRLDVDEIRNKQVPLVDVVGTDGARTVTELADAGSGSARIGILQRHVRSWTDGAVDLHPSVDAMVHRLTSDPTCTVSELAREIGLSERQLLRRCTVTFGYGPATLRRILRVQRFLRDRRPGVRPRRADRSGCCRRVRRPAAPGPRLADDRPSHPGSAGGSCSCGPSSGMSDPSTTPAADDGRLQGHRSQGGRR